MLKILKDMPTGQHAASSMDRIKAPFEVCQIGKCISKIAGLQWVEEYGQFVLTCADHANTAKAYLTDVKRLQKQWLESFERNKETGLRCNGVGKFQNGVAGVKGKNYY